MRLIVARIGKAHGLRGEVTVELRTDAPEERFTPGAVFALTGPAPARGARPATGPVAGGLTALTLESVRDHNGVLLLAFEEILDRSAAEALRGATLEADVPDESDEDDAWYDHELVGLRAEAPDGELLGSVVAVDHLPAQDLLTIKRPDGVRRLVPFVSAIVPLVDVAGGRVVIDAPPGLLEDLED